jgi:hypothetical protein
MRRKCLLSVVALSALMLVGVVFSPGTIIQLTNNSASDPNTVRDDYPSISGDGSKIAFQSNVNGGREIFLWDEETASHPQPLPESGLSTTIIAIVIVVVASVTTILYLIIRRMRRSKRAETKNLTQ